MIATNMPIEVAAVRRPVLAALASVRLLFTVRPKMHGEVGPAVRAIIAFRVETRVPLGWTLLDGLKSARFLLEGVTLL